GGAPASHPLGGRRVAAVPRTAGPDAPVLPVHVLPPPARPLRSAAVAVGQVPAAPRARAGARRLAGALRRAPQRLRLRIGVRGAEGDHARGGAGRVLRLDRVHRPAAEPAPRDPLGPGPAGGHGDRRRLGPRRHDGRPRHVPEVGGVRGVRPGAAGGARPAALAQGLGRARADRGDRRAAGPDADRAGPRRRRGARGRGRMRSARLEHGRTGAGAPARRAPDRLAGTPLDAVDPHPALQVPVVLRQRARAALRPRGRSAGGARPRRLRRSCRRAAPAPGAADRRARAAGGGLRAGPCAGGRAPRAVRGGLGAGARAALTRREPIPTEVVPGRPRRRIRRGGPARWDGGMSETIPSPDYTGGQRLARTTAVTLAWW